METNDYDSDIAFGVWLRDQRTFSGISIEQVSRLCGLSVERLKSLEIGYAEKGITYPESQKLSAIYKISFDDFIRRALGKTPDKKQSIVAGTTGT
jgi:transcriptional regulator with XRE-family HTH domain